MFKTWSIALLRFLHESVYSYLFIYSFNIYFIYYIARSLSNTRDEENEQSLTVYTVAGGIRKLTNKQILPVLREIKSKAMKREKELI